MQMQEMKVEKVHTMEEAVAQGARLLDHYRPGWEQTVHGAITAGMFEIANFDRCMMGTLELYSDHVHYGGSIVSFNGLSFRAMSDESRWVGFFPIVHAEDLEEDSDPWDELDRLWHEAVAERLGS